MRKLLAGALALVTLAALCGYGFWTLQRPEGHYPSDLRIELALNQGVPGEHGNLLGVEPLLYPGDYQNLTRLHRKLSAYLEQARAQGWSTRAPWWYCPSISAPGCGPVAKSASCTR